MDSSLLSKKVAEPEFELWSDSKVCTLRSSKLPRKGRKIMYDRLPLRIIHSGPQSQKERTGARAGIWPLLYHLEVQMAELEGALRQETRLPSATSALFRSRNCGPSSEALCPKVPRWWGNNSTIAFVAARVLARNREHIPKVQLKVWAGWRGPIRDSATGRSC